MRRPSDFIIPCSPVLRRRPPTGEAWLHEIKFDGWRVQLHKRGRDVAIYTRRGHDFTARLRTIAAAAAALPSHSAIIVGELTACDDRGLPNFHALHFRRRSDNDNLCVWAFDLLELNGRDLRELPLEKRKHSLQKLFNKIADDRMRFFRQLRRRRETARSRRSNRPGRHRLETPRPSLPLRPLRLGQSEVPRLARSKQRPPRIIQKPPVVSHCRCS
jgi:ATP-dependent DNA ligase